MLSRATRIRNRIRSAYLRTERDLAESPDGPGPSCGAEAAGRRSAGVRTSSAADGSRTLAGARPDRADRSEAA
jgi:hypothetical protein